MAEVEVYKTTHFGKENFLQNSRKLHARQENDFGSSRRDEVEFNRDEYLAFMRELLIVRYFIENQIYDLQLINEVLDHYGCPILGD